MAAMEKVCARPSTPQAAWVHQIYAARGVGGFIAMVVVLLLLLGELCFLCAF